MFWFALVRASGSAQVGTVPDSLTSLKKLSVEELMDIEVTSVSRHPEKLLEAASAVQVVSGDDIRRFGALTLPEALRLADNLDVAQKNSHDWGISARGFNTELANKLLVLMDGRTVYTPLFSGVVWDVQDYLLADIDRIEVISGPGATLWGANAVNGVINITSKSAKETQGLYLEGGAGSEIPGFAGMRYGGALSSRAYFRIYGKFFEQDKAVLASGADATDAWRHAQGGFRFDAKANDRDSFTVQGDLYHGRDHMLTGGEDDVSGGNLLGRWIRATAEGEEMSLQVYYDRTHVAQPVPAFVINGTVFARAGNFSDDLDTLDVDFQRQLSLGARHRIVWGAGYRRTHDHVGNAPALAFFPATLDQNLFSAFLQDEIVFSEKSSVTLGSKVEHNDYTGLEVEPSARFQWNFSPSQALWSAVSRAVRTPSRVDRDLSQPAPPSLVILRGSQDFSSETVVAYELGYRAQLDPRSAVSVSAFYNEYDDIRSTSITTATILPFYFANNLAGETHGFELSADFRPVERWRLHAGYRLLKERVEIKAGQFDLNNALNETSDPEQQFSLRSALDVTDHLEVNAAWRWVDARPAHAGSTPGLLPEYSELDVRVAWRPFEYCELSLVGKNLLHDQHPEYGYPAPDRVEIQRSIFGKVAWSY
ncbi:MAG: TonB-dependent receptor, plug [Verrucomicrobia bacterium]|nr:TonB-dependent receptor, plug [Verrucomicrobiota bacterium]